MIELLWVVAGTIVGLLISTVLVPPTRKESTVPMPNDPYPYHTPSGCVRVVSTEVPCPVEADSLNVLASIGNK
jgi:hypothetical protein